jgi:hemolysin D
VPKGRELEFLPAVLELQESPPSPAGRSIIFLIIGLFTAALLWSVFGHIDIVAVAQGKIIPSDYSKVIQPLESGIIKKIHVREGRHVKSGDVLIELDATTTGADRERFSNEYLSAADRSGTVTGLDRRSGHFHTPERRQPHLCKYSTQSLARSIVRVPFASESGAGIQNSL